MRVGCARGEARSLFFSLFFFFLFFFFCFTTERRTSLTGVDDLNEKFRSALCFFCGEHEILIRLTRVSRLSRALTKKDKCFRLRMQKSTAF